MYRGKGGGPCPSDYPCPNSNSRRFPLQWRMPYPEFFVEPMRLELTQLGVDELRTPEQVDAAVAAGPGTLMIVVNSVCGCAAGKARPGVALALRHSARPDRIATVFAGADVEATNQLDGTSRDTPRSPRRLPSFATGNRVHARAAQHRKPRRFFHRRRAVEGFRQVLRASGDDVVSTSIQRRDDTAELFTGKLCPWYKNPVS